MTKEEIEPKALLPALKKELGSECEGVDDQYLLMFLYWKASVKRAAERYRDFLKWKKSEKGSFDETLRITKDPELERLLLSEVMVSPPSLLTKEGGPIMLGRFRNNDMTDGRTTEGVCRMMFYNIDRLLQREETQKYGITIIHDLRGFDKAKNARIEIAKRLFKGFLGQFPIQVKAIYICQAPMVFIGFFKIVSTLLIPKKLRERIHFIDEFHELNDVYDVVDPKDLLTEMGGALEWSIQDWVDEQKKKELSGDSTVWSSLTDVNPKSETETK
mmetsp:Transcript_13153/g.27835  ORF Transcript_13153/g.27835 Transcript_13153/m.27835 type:complete len:273 (+) Transcript_13153:158-976(+)|eukprot:CAMPEP_0201121926 /NCGR_PEP_ID=MMETSP0850-20130426/5685_1 /ASSEMBLY_ACC=CAM_ASM_000622 /TAXON_ID=183588 /ORGANISM="Pseudo-nitzschia fraudulenta, Strain WWA7" /LENGTH=272 /DNA_ID=CAMNT_0047388493 /DNA_START=183 /DNA_END=1001 /DNA_ORIENTATION=+